MAAMRTSLLAACLALAPSAAAAQTPSATSAEPPKVERLEIVDRAIAHHGGDLYERSKTAMTICSRSGCFGLTVRREGGRFQYLVEEQGEDGAAGRRVRVSNDRAEEWRDGEWVELSGEEAQRARDFASARVYFPFLPYRLNDPATYKQDLGLERWGDEELHKVKVSFAPGSSTAASDQYLYWFDPTSGRLVQFAYDFGQGERAGVRFRRLVEPRRAGGILFADQTNLGAEAPDIQVDVVTPEFVAQEMREVSNVTLQDITVEPLEP